MIQIIAGTFGYYNGRKVIPIPIRTAPNSSTPSWRPVWSRKASPSTSTQHPLRPRIPTRPTRPAPMRRRIPASPGEAPSPLRTACLSTTRI